MAAGGRWAEDRDLCPSTIMYAQLTYAPQQPLPWIAQFFAITDVTTHLDQGAAGYRKKLI